MNGTSTLRRVLVVSGSARAASTNTAFCRTAATCAPEGVVVDNYLSIALLPHFNPDHDHDPLPFEVTALRAAIATAAAVLFCTPEYAGTLPGSFKNLLDWLVGGTEISGKRVAWCGVAADPGRGHGAHTTLDTVLRYVQATTVLEACQHVPVTRDAIGRDGRITDPRIRERITRILELLLNAH
ncbi:MAG TPA: NADPH-dependent FMN reductase [Acidothermaceae bacterium]|jgi:NAD(P)H-dependent FMN reductase